MAKGISFGDSVVLRDVEAHTNVHEGGTESLTFILYGGETGVYCNIGFHFKHGELKALAEMLLRTHAAGHARIDADEREEAERARPLAFTHANGEIVEVR